MPACLPHVTNPPKTDLAALPESWRDVARVVQFLRALGDKIPPASPPSEVQPVLEAALWELFENAPPGGPEIILDVKGERAAESVAVTIRPRRFLGVAMEELSLEIPLS